MLCAHDRRRGHGRLLCEWHHRIFAQPTHPHVTRVEGDGGEGGWGQSQNVGGHGRREAPAPQSTREAGLSSRILSAFAVTLS